jgi:hypothetical protein
MTNQDAVQWAIVISMVVYSFVGVERVLFVWEELKRVLDSRRRDSGPPPWKNF